jgi:hypothetical protein
MNMSNFPDDIDLKFLEDHEGFTSKFVYPGGVSGPTIGTGIDIGNLDRKVLDVIFAKLAPVILIRVKSGYGLKSAAAKAWCKMNGDIMIPRDILVAAEKYIYGIFWTNVVKRFKGIEKAPGAVKTAVFSVSYNRGVFNKELAPIIGMVANNDWKGIADCLHDMQQSHPLPGIRTRRRDETMLVYKSIGIEF